MAPMSRETARLIGTLAESLLYGINLVLVCSCLFVLTRRKGREATQKIVVAAITLQFPLSTISAVLDVWAVLMTFISYSGTTIIAKPNSNALEVLKIASVFANSILRDSILVWRVYRVWDRKWKVVAFPIVLVLGTIVCSIGQVITCARYGCENIHVQALGQWIEPLFILAIVANVVCIGLLSFLVCSSMHRFPLAHAALFWRLFILVIESGMVYSAVLVLSFTLYLRGHNSFFIVFYITGQLAAVMPIMTFLLVGLKLTTADDLHRRRTTSDIEP